MGRQPTLLPTPIRHESEALLSHGDPLPHRFLRVSMYAAVQAQLHKCHQVVRTDGASYAHEDNLRNDVRHSPSSPCAYNLQRRHAGGVRLQPLCPMLSRPRSPSLSRALSLSRASWGAGMLPTFEGARANASSASDVSSM